MTSRSLKRILGYTALVVVMAIIAGGYYGYRIYSRMYAKNVNLEDKEHVFIHIPTDSRYSDVLSLLDSVGIIRDVESFKWVSSRMGYPYSIKAGRYKVEEGMNNRELITNLRAGLQTPLRLTFTGFRTPMQLAERISSQIEADSAEIVAAFLSHDIPNEYGFTQESFIAMFIPNTYEFFWNTSAKGFFNRMKREYETFWTETRDAKAKEIGLNRIQVSTLASIVEEETIKADERLRVAGVFINRLNRNMLLQADPTIKFAHGDFAMRRILTRHLDIDSPYNTYKYRGLPPGPINSPSTSSINAVLNYEKHQYYYFCARPDYSGYHAFARTLAEHNRNARAYQNFLNRERIFR